MINESVLVWLNEFDEVTDKRLLWDLIKYRIRQVPKKYSKEKTRKKRKQLSDIEISLMICEERCDESPTLENQEELEMLKMEYDSMYEQIAKGNNIRSKATWYGKGKKSNKYFLNLQTIRKPRALFARISMMKGW